MSLIFLPFGLQGAARACWLALISLISCLLPASPARGGELYAFTIGGRVLYQFIGGPDQPQADDPFTIRFIADSQDLGTSSNSGRFAVTDFSIDFPNITYPGLDSLQYLVVKLFATPGAVDILQLTARVQNPQDIFPYTLDLGLVFPDGTLSDTLPLTVPLSAALIADFEMYIGFSVNMEGEVLSYQSARIPEPTNSLLLTAVSSFAWRRKR